MRRRGGRPGEGELGGGGRCVRSSAQARGGGGGHVGAGGPGAAGDPSGLGQPRVHRGDHQLHQEDRGLSQLLRHVVPVPAGHPEREADGAGAQDRVHRGPGHQGRDADVGLGRPRAPLSPPEHRRPAPRSGPAAASACVANKPLCSCPACSLPACLGPGRGMPGSLSSSWMSRACPSVRLTRRAQPRVPPHAWGL